MTAVSLFKSMRPPFLVLPPVCVLLGIGAAVRADALIDIGLATAILMGAMLAHMSVNLLNEYADFKSGLDLNTLKTPFSGGSGALVSDPGAARAVLFAGVFTLSLVALLGLYIVAQRGPAILPIGLLGVAVVLAYTPWLNRNPWLCLIAPGLGFGPLMVGGTYVALTGHYAPAPFAVSLVPFFLVSNLLLLNQYPDVDADRRAGRYHAPIAYGLGVSTKIYTAFAAFTALSVAGCVLTGIMPPLGWVALVPLAATLRIVASMRAFRGDVGALLPAMGMNVAVSVSTPLVCALAMLFG